MFKRISQITLAAALLAVPVGLAGNAQASGSSTTTKSTVTAAAAIRDCIDVANRDVGLNNTGNYVKEVQCLLNWAVNPSTYHLIDEDGDFGPDTEGKVYKFQRCYNASHNPNIGVDGRVGPETAPKLESYARGSDWVC